MHYCGYYYIQTLETQKQMLRDHSIAELNILSPKVLHILTYYKTQKHPTDITYILS